MGTETHDGTATASARDAVHRAQHDFTTEYHTYEPHRAGLPPLLTYLRELWRRREFAREMSRTDLRAEHFNTAFGQLWLVLNPLLLAGVYFLLIDILRRGHRPPDFFAHLIAGIFAYYFVSGAVREAAKSVVGGGRLVLNTAFPRALLPLSTVITAFTRFIPTLIVYIPVHIASGLSFGPHLLWAIPIVALLAGVATGLSLIVAALQVYFRDLSKFLPYMLRIWLYISPVLYFAYDMPERYKWLLTVNPIGGLLTAWSEVLIRGVAPQPQDMLEGLAWAIFLVVAGGLFFVSREREFAVRL